MITWNSRTRTVAAAFGALVLTGGAAGEAVATGTATAVELQPHRANYALRMVSAKGSSRFVNVQGATTTMLERTCDGWIVAERVAMHMDTQTGDRIRRDLRFTGWESSDGKRYRFASKALTNGRAEDFKGQASIEAGSAGRADYSTPPDVKLPLPRDTVFYVTFTRWLLQQAVAGRLHGEVVVFDGADDEGPERAIVFITPVKGAAEKGRDLGPLAEGRSWNIRMAFYPVDLHTSEPDFEVEARMLENGVATRFRIEFADFTVLQEAQQLEAIAPPEC